MNTCKTPFIIAEMSGNHNQSLDRALEIVDLAADAGVDALNNENLVFLLKYYDLILGRRVSRDIKRGTVLSLNLDLL